MSGETDLDKLLSTMSPKLLDDDYVFCTMANGRYGDYPELEPIASFTEDEGLTLVIRKAVAEQHNISYETVLKAITLTVHSSLEAVGLTAVVATKLTEKGISANVIAAYYHDHIFVQANRAEDALAALKELVH
jgi:hypothetical protein